MRRPLLFLLAGAVLGLLACVRAGQPGRAKHVVLIVWDGMRPDFVSKENTPHLWQLAQEGVTFRKHHSAYPTVTNVNGTVLATGVFPGRSGLIANNEFRPEINVNGAVDTGVEATIRKGDEVTAGRYLAVPTIPELLRRDGRSAAIAGTKWVTGLFDRALGSGADAERGAIRVVDGTAVPNVAQRVFLDSLGGYPEKGIPNHGQDRWTTDALTEILWKDAVPDFSLLWLSDPDFTEHAIAAGSPEALRAIGHSDAMLGKVLAALDTKGVRAQTDVFVVSDHGFSTIERAHDLPMLMEKAGFRASKRFADKPESGSILVVGNAGTASFYIMGRDEKVTRRLVEWLQQSDFAGVIFTREKMEGTFAIADVRLAKEDGPDAIMAFRWNEQPNRFGTQGMIMADWNRAAGKGTHASLSKFDVHNILFAAGPDFRRGYASEVPSGNIDVAPTILRILGLDPPVPLDGRVLSEAMTNGEEAEPAVTTSMMEATRSFASSKWRQYLKLSQVGKHVYFDEGNGASSAGAPR